MIRRARTDVKSAGAPTLVLASSSPRRRELLASLGWRIAVVDPNVDETPWPSAGSECPEAYVRRLAKAKAQAVLARPQLRPHLPLGALPVLAADTAVAIGGKILGKPRDDAEARTMLRQLSGRRHEVWTGVCLARRQPRAAGGRARLLLHAELTHVWMVSMSAEEIDAYVASGEPRDKAGAYAIQGRAAQFIARIEGSYTNVVGLPLTLVRALLQRDANARPTAPR